MVIGRLTLMVSSSVLTDILLPFIVKLQRRPFSYDTMIIPSPVNRSSLGQERGMLK